MLRSVFPPVLPLTLQPLEIARKWPVWVALLLGLGILALVVDWQVAAPPDALRNATFVGASNCSRCHQQEHEQWLGSHHDRAMQLATDESVLGDFADAEFDRLGVKTRFFRDGPRFMVSTEGPDGEQHDYEVKYTFGYEPLQQYMVEFPDGRVQVLRVSWDTKQGEWFYVPPPDVPDERLKPDDPLHWTGVAQNWNTTCAICHSTNLQKGYDLATDSYHTTYSEINVSCEECHGPGSLHIQLAEANSLFWDRRHGYGLAQLKSVDNRPQIEACAECHARRQDVHPDFRPGTPLLDSYAPSPLDEGLYHADGQILDEVYVYGSFLQSKMFHEGVRCTDCHNPHSLQLKFDGNALCTQCHVPAKYDTPSHHHHAVGSKAANCVECHMPTKTYMVVDDRRDHSLRMPRPDQTVALGTPNACNVCHTKPEEDAAWAAEKVVEWYGPKRPNDPHWAPALAAGRARQPEGERLLAELCARQNTPNLVKATALELLAAYPGDAATKAAQGALQSLDPQVRLSAVRMLSSQSREAVVQTLVEHLDDPSRAVRVESARRLAGLPADSFTVDQYRSLESGLDEYRQQQEMNLDRAASHLNLGQLAVAQDRRSEAVQEFRKAIQLEPYLSGSRRLLAQTLAGADGEPQEVERLYREEIDLLVRDTELAPDRGMVWYELGRLRVLVGDYQEASPAFSRALELEPENYQFRLMHVLSLERQYEQTADADVFAETVAALKSLEALAPGRTDARAILRRLLETRERLE